MDTFVEKSRAMAELRQQQQEEEQRSGLDATAADEAGWAEPANLASSSYGGGSSSTMPSQRAGPSSGMDVVDAEDDGVAQSMNETDRQMEIMKAANAARKAADMAKKVEKEEARLKSRFATIGKVLEVGFLEVEGEIQPPFLIMFPVG